MAMSCQGALMGWMMAAIAIINIPLKTLLPNIAPSPTSSCPRSFEIIVVANSGMEVPMATMVAPMMNSSTPNDTAISLAPKTIRLPAAIRNARPVTHENATRHNLCSPITTSVKLLCLLASVATAPSHTTKRLSMNNPSTLDSSPSRNNTPVTMGMIRAVGKSRLMLSRVL